MYHMCNTSYGLIFVKDTGGLRALFWQIWASLERFSINACIHRQLGQTGSRNIIGKANSKKVNQKGWKDKVGRRVSRGDQKYRNELLINFLGQRTCDSPPAHKCHQPWSWVIGANNGGRELRTASTWWQNSFSGGHEKTWTLSMLSNHLNSTARNHIHTSGCPRRTAW